jgi:hypothetical protein
MNQYRSEVLSYLDKNGSSRQKELVNSIVDRYLKWKKDIPKWRIRMAIQFLAKEGKIVSIVSGFPPHKILSIPKT